MHNLPWSLLGGVIRVICGREISLRFCFPQIIILWLTVKCYFLASTIIEAASIRSRIFLNVLSGFPRIHSVIKRCWHSGNVYVQISWTTKLGFGLNYKIMGNWHATFVHYCHCLSSSTLLSPSSIYIFFHTGRLPSN